MSGFAIAPKNRSYATGGGHVGASRSVTTPIISRFGPDLVEFHPNLTQNADYFSFYSPKQSCTTKGRAESVLLQLLEKMLFSFIGNNWYFANIGALWPNSFLRSQNPILRTHAPEYICAFPLLLITVTRINQKPK